MKYNSFIRISSKRDRVSEVTLEPPPEKRVRSSATTTYVAEERSQSVVKTSAVDKQNDEYDILGKTYAAKLRRMPAPQRDISDKLINDILFKGLLNQLTPCTVISNSVCTPGNGLPTTQSPVSTNYARLNTSPISAPSSERVKSPEQYPREYDLQTLFKAEDGYIT